MRRRLRMGVSREREGKEGGGQGRHGEERRGGKKEGWMVGK